MIIWESLSLVHEVSTIEFELRLERIDQMHTMIRLELIFSSGTIRADYLKNIFCFRSNLWNLAKVIEKYIAWMKSIVNLTWLLSKSVLLDERSTLFD